MAPHPKPQARPRKPGGFRKAPKKPLKAREAAPKAKKPRTANLKPRKVVSTGTTKSQIIADMLVKGATSKEMEAATGWAPHSVRGLLGTMRKKGVKVVSTKLKGEPTVYSVATPEPL